MAPPLAVTWNAMIWFYFSKFSNSVQKYPKDFLKQNIPEQIPATKAILIIIPPKIEDFEIDGINNTGDAINTKTILTTTTAMTNEIEPINIFINLSLFSFIQNHIQ